TTRGDPLCREARHPDTPAYSRRQFKGVPEAEALGNSRRREHIKLLVRADGRRRPLDVPLTPAQPHEEAVCEPFPAHAKAEVGLTRGYRSTETRRCRDPRGQSNECGRRPIWNGSRAIRPIE